MFLEKFPYRVKFYTKHVTQAPFLERSLRSGENSFYKNCGEAATAALGPAGPVKPKDPWTLGPFILRIFFHNPFPQPFSTTRGAGSAPLRPKGAEPF